MRFKAASVHLERSIMTLQERFAECIAVPWKTAGLDVQYRVERDRDNARVFFQWTVSLQDALIDLDFPAKIYKDEPYRWYTHGGFGKAFKSVEDTLKKELEGVKSVYCAGYSLGGALATLFHEWAWFNLDAGVLTYTFGAPRVLWIPGKKIKERFENLIRVANRDDWAAAMPPASFCYKHVGKPVIIGSDWIIKKSGHDYTETLRGI